MIHIGSSAGKHGGQQGIEEKRTWGNLLKDTMSRAKNVVVGLEAGLDGHDHICRKERKLL
jgi:hypothetical protein